jgi:hypothetical protein
MKLALLFLLAIAVPVLASTGTQKTTAKSKSSHKAKSSIAVKSAGNGVGIAVKTTGKGDEGAAQKTTSRKRPPKSQDGK